MDIGGVDMKEFDKVVSSCKVKEKDGKPSMSCHVEGFKGGKKIKEFDSNMEMDVWLGFAFVEFRIRILAIFVLIAGVIGAYHE